MLCYRKPSLTLFKDYINTYDLFYSHFVLFKLCKIMVSNFLAIDAL